MKNRHTLIISSVLLGLCIYEKNASDKAVRIENTKNMFNVPSENYNNNAISGETVPSTRKNETIETPDYQTYAMLQFSSADSTSEVKNQSKL
jgi:hypothetical protein